jgi:hypothetical protein
MERISEENEDEDTYRMNQDLQKNKQKPSSGTNAKAKKNQFGQKGLNAVQSQKNF